MLRRGCIDYLNKILWHPFVSVNHDLLNRTLRMPIYFLYMANNVATFVIPEKVYRDYFKLICKIIDEKHEEFPVNLDDVWPWVYADKGKAVRALKDGFIEDIDYHRLPEMASGSKTISEGGANRVTYLLSISCLEFFIARKKREVFEIYRQVFHAARRGELPQKTLTKSQQMLITIKLLLKWLRCKWRWNANKWSNKLS